MVATAASTIVDRFRGDSRACTDRLIPADASVKMFPSDENISRFPEDSVREGCHCHLSVSLRHVDYIVWGQIFIGFVPNVLIRSRIPKKDESERRETLSSVRKTISVSFAMYEATVFQKRRCVSCRAVVLGGTERSRASGSSARYFFRQNKLVPLLCCSIFPSLSHSHSLSHTHIHSTSR